MAEVLFLILIGYAIGATGWIIAAERDRNAAWRYAANRADSTESGQAYSDMASVIVLGHRAVRHRSRAPGGDT